MKKLLVLIVLSFSFQSIAQNNAFTFNGIDQQIATYTQQTQINFTTGNFTIEAWVKPATFVGGSNSFEHTILGNDIWSGTNNTGYVLRTGGSKKLDFTFGNGNNWYSVVSTNPVFTVDEWTHVAIVRNGTTFTLYADGQQVGQQTFTQNLVQSLGNLRIGENGNGSGRFFNGAMDEVKFWSVARTQAQVQDDLNATDMTTPPTDLKVYYKMNQTTGQDVISETLFNLTAKYLPTAAVNSTTGFYRIYTFIGGGDPIGLWTISTNWKNNFIPPDNQNQNNIINITATCRLNINTLTISNGVTLNILTNGILSTNPSDSSNNTINNYGILNVQNKLIIARDSHSLYNYGSININSFGTFEANTPNVYFKTGSVCNNYGSIAKSPTNTFDPSLNIETGAILTNFNGATIDCIKVTNAGVIENNGLLTVFTYTTNNSSCVLTNSLAGIFRAKLSVTNFGLITNYGTINLDKQLAGSLYSYTNQSTGIINNIGQQSNFLINNSFVKFQNLGSLTTETPTTNKGDFVNDTSGTFKLNGIYSSFENTTGATFTNSGTFITKNSVYNIGSYTNNNLHTGNANFNSSIFINNSNGIIAPSTDTGSGIGTLSFLNSLTNNGQINIEIGGTNASNTFDKVNVTGTATLGGVLNVSLLNNYQPPIGSQTYTILTATTRTGTFATVNFPNLSGTTWAITYNPTNVVISSTTTALATNDFQFAGFKAYPNPTNTILNLKNSQTIDSIRVFDIIGKNVLSQTFNSSDGQVDISSLQNGIFFLKIQSEGNEKIIKIIKN